MKNLNSIAEKFSNLQYNSDNYYVGGGLANGGKFESNRHNDAKCDFGKLTLGEATALFKKATGMDTASVREVINYAVPVMEWHHAGLLPKQYGGGMKKTYFLNAEQIADLAKNWLNYVEKLAASKIAEKKAAEEKNSLEARKFEVLKTYAKKIERTTNRPQIFYQTAQEMNGKFGWFDSTYKSYNLTEYYSGWEFESEEKYIEFKNLK